MLKYLFTIAVFALFVSIGIAQENSIVNERMLWSNLREICEVGGNTYSTFFNRFEGDTLVEGKTYKKVFISEDEAARFWIFTEELVREENGRVYYRDQSGNEGLIYDFNLLPGDEVTVTNTLAPDGLKLTMVEIDSVETFDGYRKRWKLILDEFSAPEYWIEGIGSESGVLNSGIGVFLGICGIYYLLCASEAGNQVYVNPFYNTCYYTLLDDGDGFVEKTELPEIKYLPRSKTVSISYPAKSNGQLIITGISGKVMLKSVIPAGQSTFDCSSYPSGIYVVTLIGKESITSARLIFY